MKILFFSSKTFLTHEIIGALKKRSDITTVVVDIPWLVLVDEMVEIVFSQIKHHLPAIVMTVNNAGTDYAGVLLEKIAATDSHVVNWYTDDPTYEPLFYARVIKPCATRIDFVTEATFVPLLRNQGYAAHFLPLAADPAFFNSHGVVALERDVAFVGNSSLEFLDTVISEPIEQELTRCAPLLAAAHEHYCANPQIDLEAFLLGRASEWESALRISKERFLFSVQWLVGYLFRRDAIVALAACFGTRFTCFGDAYWTRFIDASLVSTQACYYTNLCTYYRSTRVNIDINRIQIRTSFTQRVFDCLASGAFLLTDARLLNKSFFVMDGEDKELVEFSTLKECIQRAQYYCDHEDEAHEIALRGQKKVLTLHTYDHRIDLLISLCKEAWGI